MQINHPQPEFSIWNGWFASLSTPFSALPKVVPFSLESIQEAVRLCYDAEQRFLSEVAARGFATEEEEIYVRREIQVTIAGHLFYYQQLLQFVLQQPVGMPARGPGYITAERAKVREFFNEHTFFFRLSLLESTPLDPILFLARHSGSTQSVALIPFAAQSSFPGQVIMAWVKAYRLFDDYLMAMEVYEREQQYRTFPTAAARLKWAKKKVDLIELCYALHAAGAFGNTHISDIVKFAESHFGVNLDKHGKTFYEVTLRQAGPDLFLQELSSALRDKIDRLNERSGE